MFNGWVEALKEGHAELLRETGVSAMWSNFTASFAAEGPSLLSTIHSQIMLFIEAIDWTEPFFRYLLAFHVAVVAITVFVTYGPVSDERLFFTSVVIIALAFLSYFLNQAGASYAAVLFREEHVNYFDPSGVFIAAVYWLPLVLVAVALQIRLICRVASLMIQVKRQQARVALRQRQRGREAAESDAVAAATSAEAVSDATCNGKKNQ